jgi:hypothetical protein
MRTAQRQNESVNSVNGHRPRTPALCAIASEAETGEATSFVARVQGSGMRVDRFARRDLSPRFATFNWAGGMSVEGSSRDARLPEPLRQSVDVGLVAKREPRNVLDK